jgi:hypothetical protein
MVKKLEEAELIEWDGSSMIFCDEWGCHRDGWFDSPDDLLDYLADEELEDIPEFAFVGERIVKELDLDSAIEQMTEDTYEDAEVCATREDMTRLQEAVAMFNAKYSVTYFEHSYKTKIRIRPETPDHEQKS